MLITPYQKTELIIGTLLFFIMFYGLYRFLNKEINYLEVFIMGIFIFLILLVKDISLNYTIMTSTIENQ